MLALACVVGARSRTFNSRSCIIISAMSGPEDHPDTPGSQSGAPPVDRNGRIGGQGGVDSRRSDDVPEALSSAVERAFTCTNCGYQTIHEVAPLRASVGATCANCSNWTVQTGEEEELIVAAEDAAKVLDGNVVTERQALAFLLRDVVGVSRQTAAHVLDSSPSNVDNLQRKGREKLDEARRTVAGVDALSTGTAATPPDADDA